MSNIKEPYSISVWEEELIPVQDWYVKGEEKLTREEYEQLPEIEREGYELHTVMEHYEETQGIIIGAHDMDSVYAAVNPIFKENVNGSVDLTFGLYYKVYDPDALDFYINPFTQLLKNEAKVKLHFRDKWYDLVVKSCVEDSTNFVYNYTCKDIYVNELNKNGFKVELDTELENNQATVTELAETILLDTDWQVDKENSDIIVETKIEPLYIGILNQDVIVKKVNNYTPDDFADMSGQWPLTGEEEDENREPVSEITIIKGSKVLFFYSDITENVKQPQFLARIAPVENSDKYTTIEPDTEEGIKNYLTDVNEDIIINAYNYQIISPAVYYIDSDIEYNIPSVTEEKVDIYDYARGEKVIKSQLSGYDPDLDQFIFKFYKKDDDNNIVEYYGYTKTEHLTSDLAQNYLANSDNFTSLESGWYFDGIPAKTVKICGKEKTAAYSGQIFNVSDPTMIGKDSKNGQESVLVLQLRNEEDEENRVYYPDNQGEFYLIHEEVTENGVVRDYRDITSKEAKAFEDDLRAYIYDQRDYYVEGYADKTDDELDDIINEVLLSKRYSYRSRYAVNNGVAANRKAIESLTPGEEYLFAVSLGKFTDNEKNPIPEEQKPQYGREIQYGGKVPTEFYEFSDSEEHRDFIIKAVREALGKDDTKWADKYKEHKYYYHHPEYEKTYIGTYKAETNKAEKAYEDKFLFGLNSVNRDAKALWRSGGRKYRNEIFLEYLRDNKKFITIDGKTEQVGICEYLANCFLKVTTTTGVTKQIYDMLIQTTEILPDKDNPNRNVTHFSGIYPKMVQLTVNEAEEKQKTPWTIDAYWEPIAYNDTMFPAFDPQQQDIVTMYLSFNESLFGAIYQGLKQAFVTVTKAGTVNDIDVYQYDWNKENIGTDPVALAGKIETLLKTIYKAAYEEGKFLNVYDQAKQYKMPGLGFPQGGEIYRTYKARWEADAAIAAEAAAKASVKNIDELFSMPECIYEIGNDTLAVDKKNSQDKNTELEDCYEELLGLANFIQDKIEAFKQDYSIEEIEKNTYNEFLTKQYPNWVKEFLINRYPNENENNHHAHSRLYGQYYYANFLPNFLEAWVSEQEVGTYVLAEDKYELNGKKLEVGETPEEGNVNTSILSLGIINAENKIKNPAAKHFVQSLYSTSPEGAYAAAYKTNYNPYLSTDAGDAGGYVFDRNEEVIRLYDPNRDMIGATYKPVKSDDGDYIYDVFEQVYRPFRNWSVTEKRNPVNFEIDNEKGVYGDITEHPMKAFDGHIGSWEETPTRYRMVRLREDPINTKNNDESLKYKYLPKEITVDEIGHYKGENYKYIVTYPIGYQTDSYSKDDDGQYVLASQVKRPRRPDLFVKVFGKDAYWHLFGGDDYKDDEGDFYQITDKEKKTLWHKIGDWFKALLKLNNGEDDDISGVYTDSETGLLTSNNSREGYYDEDIETIVSCTYTINDQKFIIDVPVLNDISTQAEGKNVIEKGLAEKIKDQNGTKETVIIKIEGKKPDEIDIDRYIKYKKWYWRHWGAQRYEFNPKICVQKTVNGLTIFKPFNKVEDSISDDYRIIECDVDGAFENKRDDETIAFYLKKPKRQFRTAKELDYGTRKYRMELQNKKKKEYWVESPNGEAYLRHYKTGDGEIKLWDGHFGKWIDCFLARSRPAEEKLNEDSYWFSHPDYPGLVVSYKENDKDKGIIDTIALPEYYLQYGDIMIPWDARVLNRDKKFTRQRVEYRKNDDDNLYVLSDDVYISLKDYYDNNGFVGNLNYSDLKISFVTDFKYDATNFAIKDLPQNREEYLSFDLGKTTPSTIDLIVSKKDDEVVKERWAYWTSKVTKQFSLTENPLQTIGMLFETSRVPDENGKVQPYPFLGMQMFKHIPYTKKEVTTNITKVEKNTTEIENEVIKIYNELFGYYDGSQTLLSSQDYKYIISTLKSNKQYAAMVSKLFSEYGYVWDIESPCTLYQVDSSPITIPLFPGEPPDARDLYRTLYYIYDPEKVTDVDDVVYEYVGTEPLYDEASNPNGMFKIAYDEQCQKVRSMKGKESNYFKLLQDCCDTFDCWLEHDVTHDEVTGQVKYIEKPVYIENKLTAQHEPQMYIGQDAKERALDKKIQWYWKRFGYNPVSENNSESRIELVLDENKNPVYPPEYKQIEGQEFDDEQLLELRELNRLSYVNENLTRRFILVPDKKIRFKRYVGKENWNGFKYGVNLKHIKRTVDSNQISTRVIVKPNKNEHAKDNFCTIQRAHDNPIKENFLYDFSYYTQQGLLNQRELNNDLYTNIRSRLNYYNELARINKDNDKIIEELSSCLVDLDEVTANYETAVLKRDAAIEEIQKAALTLTSNYDTYGQVLDTPWTPNKAREYITRKQTSAPATSFQTQVKLSTGEDLDITIDVSKTATEVYYPKYNDALRTLLDQMDIYQEEYAQSLADIEKYEPEKKRLEARIAELQEQQRIIVDKKNELNKLFYHKYSRFIQEGSWIDENYIDDNLYYLDALSVMRTSCKPKITYDIGVVDIAAASEYEEDRLVLESELGDRTYVEDTEFFGYREDKITPYWELVVVSEKIYNLDDASQNQTKVKNYSTQFDDLFQRIAATSQTLQFNEGSYSRAAAIIDNNGTINSELLQQSIEDGNIIAWGAKNEDIQSDNTGITIQNSDNANVIKLVSRGIILSTDGGSTWKTAVTANGINAELLTAGRIDTKMLLIGNSENPNFFWNELGLSAFRINDKKIDYSSFVRLDQYGIYSIQNHTVADKTKLSLNDTFAPRSIKEISTNPNAVFGLTWDGFFLNASNGTGRVTIGTEQDFKMSEFSDARNAWIDKVIIGRLSDKNGSEYYGFRLKNNDNQIVMETNESGELYLKKKLRISNFSDVSTYDSLIYSTEPITINGIKYEEYYKKYTTNDRGQNYIEYYSLTDIKNPLKTETNDSVDWRDLISDPQDRVALGIVDVYDRGNNFNKIVTPKGTYSSSDYLTKVFSVKANANVGSQQFYKDHIDTLIEKNENFAIFDNGNLFARNAYIEGNIRATSGKILGTLEIGSEDQQIGVLKHSGDSWVISGDGTASFKNVNVSGAISSATFEYNQVQTIAGSMIIFPAYLVESSQVVDGYLRVYLQMTEMPSELQQLLNQQNVYANFSSFVKYTEQNLLKEYPIIGGEVDSTKNQVYITLNLNDQKDTPQIEKNTPVSIYTKNEELFGIVLNATDSGIYPKQSISIVDLMKTKNTSPKAVLGYLEPELFSNDENSMTRQKFGGTFGLYSDNAYLKGTIISESSAQIAGITTNNLINNVLSSTDREDLIDFKNKEIVFFAGTNYNIEDLNFFVTADGKLYAKDGYFTGIIEASEIRGNGANSDRPGLIFRDLDEAIHFVKTGKGNNEDSTIFNLSSKAAIFYQNNLEILNIAMNENPAIRMHQINDPDKSYLFSIEKEQEEGTEDYKILLKYKNKEVATIDEKGIKIGTGQSSIGENAYFEEAYTTDKTYIGCNMVII